jgi:hypothetical protein
MKYIIIILLLFGVGCKCFRCDEPEFKPLPPVKLFDNLLYEDEIQNIAYKSVTKKDYDDPPMEGA